MKEDLEAHNRSVLPEEDVTSGAKTDKPLSWFAMRDLKRSNAKLPAYKMLGDLKIKVFTPMVWKMTMERGKRMPKEMPFMHDLLFACTSRKELDPIVERTSTLQYRYARGGYHIPITVRDADMERFIRAVEASDSARFYAPQEITPDMVGKKIRIVGGPLAGYEGRLQKLQGSRTKRMFVELPGLLVASVEVQPEYIQIIR